MEDKTSHSPDNRSEKYLYVPTEDDYMQLYHACIKKTKICKKEKTFYCIVFEMFALVVYFVSMIAYSMMGNQYSLTMGFITLFYPIGAIVLWIFIRFQHASIYRASLRNQAKANPFFYERRWVSFDGYHLVIESDHMTVMLAIRDNVKVTYTERGLILKCHDGYRYYPRRIFGSIREMVDFYERLNWNNVYKEKYGIK